MIDRDPGNRELFPRLLEERIVFLGSEVTDEAANDICAQLLLLDAIAPGKDISLFVHSPGGSVTAGFAIYDTMQALRSDVATVAIGLAASIGQFLLTSGTRGKRFALPNASVVMHARSGGFGGTPTDIQTHTRQLHSFKQRIAELTSRQTGRPIDEVVADADQDRWFTAEEALEYGLIDAVLTEVAVLGR